MVPGVSRSNIVKILVAFIQKIRRYVDISKKARKKRLKEHSQENSNFWNYKIFLKVGDHPESRCT